jgi:four helix bundle protein
MNAEDLKQRTKKFYIDVLYFLRTVQNNIESVEIKRQLLRSSSSVAANYRAACRGRSDNEFYSKICIVVEESDESLFWLEVIAETQKCDNEKILALINESTSLLNIMAKSKKTLSERIFLAKNTNSNQQIIKAPNL